MTEDEAMHAVEKLVAAYAYPPVAEATVAVYVERLLPLDAAAVAHAVNVLIDENLAHLPRIGLIRARALRYAHGLREQRAARRYLLAAPEPSPEERAAATARVRAILASLPCAPSGR